MTELAFLTRHGYAIVFAISLLDQLGLPLPAAPLLLAAGALARTGELSGLLVATLAVLASLAGHLAWFYAGRLRGAAVLQLVCRLSLEPDSCVRKTRNLFTSRGASALVVAPFIPGLATVAPPLAGMSGMPLGRFLALDGLGAALWAFGCTAAGYALGAQLGPVLEIATRFGGSIAGAAVIALALYLAVKVVQRQQLLRSLRVARITAEELKALVDAGADVVIVDLRSALELAARPLVVPGAIRIDPEELEGDGPLPIPGDREIALYCS